MKRLNILWMNVLRLRRLLILHRVANREFVTEKEISIFNFHSNITGCFLRSNVLQSQGSWSKNRTENLFENIPSISSQIVGPAKYASMRENRQTRGKYTERHPSSASCLSSRAAMVMGKCKQEFDSVIPFLNLNAVLTKL